MQQDDIAIPILPSRSLNDPLAFCRRLGFDGKILGAPHFDAILRRGAIELRFFTHAERRPTESSASGSARVSGVEKNYRAFAPAELPTKGIPRQDALADQPWGRREFALLDPDGNSFRIGQAL